MVLDHERQPPYGLKRIGKPVASHAAVCVSSFCLHSDGAGESAHRQTHHDLGSPPLAYADMVLRSDLPHTAVPSEGHDSLVPWTGTTSVSRANLHSGETSSECQSPVNQVSVLAEMPCVPPWCTKHRHDPQPHLLDIQSLPGSHLCVPRWLERHHPGCTLHTPLDASSGARGVYYLLPTCCLLCPIGCHECCS